jgi:uncharacterized protein YdaU (DUF1376 family)
MSNPYMPLFVGDYLRDTRGLKTEEHGAYLLLLMELWNRDGALPLDHAYLARIVGVSRRKWEEKIYPVLSLYFEIKTDRLGTTLEHKRVRAELKKTSEIREARSNAGRRGAAQKWSTNKDGSMAKPQQNDGIHNHNHRRTFNTDVDDRGGDVLRFPKSTDRD